MEVDKPARGRTRVGSMLAATWIVVTTVLFLVRFSTEFYQANKGAIDKVLASLH